MSYTPKPKNKKAGVAAIVLLITAIILFFFASQYYTKGRGIVQAFGVGCLTGAAAFIILSLRSYTYYVFPKDTETKKSVSEMRPDELTFTVTKRNGKKYAVNTVQFDLDTLKNVADLPASYSERRKMIKSFGEMSVYYYNVTLMSPVYTLLIFEKEGDRRVGIVIEPDNDFKSFLNETARMNND